MRSGIAFVYHYLPHYRKGVVEALLKASDGVCFIADETSKEMDGSILTYTPSREFYRVRIVRLIGGLYWLSGLWRMLRRSRATIVVFLGDMNCISAWFVGGVCRLLGMSVYFWAHGWIDEREHWGKAMVRRIFFRIPDRILLYGRRGRRLAVAQGFSPDKVHVVYNSLDYAAQERIRSGLRRDRAREALCSRFPRLDLGTPLVLCCARLTATKRFDLVIGALAAIPEVRRPSVLFVGDGSERLGLESLARRLDVNALFAGECYDEEVLAQYFVAADVVVSPGNVGLTAMHAMAYGVPVITHGNRNRQMPEVEAIIPGVTGDFFTEGDSASLAVVIERFVHKTPFEREHARMACVRVIESFFTPQKQVEKICAALRNEAEAEVVCDAISPVEIGIQ